MMLHNTNRAKLYLLWLVLVSLNAVFSFFVAFTEYKSPLDRVGIVMGVLTFLVFYAELDYQYCSENKFSLHRLLIIGAVLKSLTQCVPVIEIVVGAVSVAVVEAVLDKTPFFSTYLITLMDGLVLSLVLTVISLIIGRTIKRLAKKQYKTQWLNRLMEI